MSTKRNSMELDPEYVARVHAAGAHFFWERKVPSPDVPIYRHVPSGFFCTLGKVGIDEAVMSLGKIAIDIFTPNDYGTHPWVRSTDLELVDIDWMVAATVNEGRIADMGGWQAFMAWFDRQGFGTR